MTNVDIAQIEAIIRHVADTVVMPKFKNLQNGDVREKGPGDFVTVADEESERVLGQMLSAALPGSLVVGEEAVSKDKGVLDILKQDKPVWVIDPIDGTYNFAHGRSKFGILVALVQNGETLYGFAYDAPQGRMVSAKKGGGAFLNGQPIRIANDKKSLKEMIGQNGGSQPWHFESVTAYFKETINLRCSLHDFMNFVTGEADFVAHTNKVTPWDHAAGCLIAQEAGGYVALDETGVEYDPTRFGSAFLIAAPSRKWWEEIHAVLYPALKKKSA